MAEKSVNEMTAVEMVKAISAGETNCEEIVRANLFAIEARENDVQAWAHVDPENALASAKAMDAAGPKGPLLAGHRDRIPRRAAWVAPRGTEIGIQTPNGLPPARCA